MINKVKVPFLGADNELAVIVSINYKNKDFVKTDDLIMTIESSKTAYEINSPSEGYIHIKVQVDQEVSENDLLAIISNSIEIDDKENEEEERSQIDNEIKFSMKAKQLIEKKNIDINLIKKIGKKFITENDIENFLNLNPQNTKVIEKNITKEKDFYEKTFFRNLTLSKEKVSPANIISSIDFINLKSKNHFEIIILAVYKILSTNQEYRILYDNENKINQYETPIIGVLSEINSKLISLPLKIDSDETEDTLMKKKLKSQLMYTKGNSSDIGLIPSFNISYLESKFATHQIPVVFHNHLGTLGVISNNVSKTLTITFSYNHFLINGKKALNFVELLCENIHKIEP